MGGKEWRNGCRTPTQDPSTHNRWFFVGAVLLLLDRSVDVAIMLQHTIAYQAQIHDLLRMRSNIVTFDTRSAAEVAAGTPAAGGVRTKQVYVVDPTNEAFFAENGKY